METLNTILQIPERSLVNKKITKAFFKRNFDLTSGERALLDDFKVVMTIDWLASVSTVSANISRFQNEQYLYEEVQIISVQTAEVDFERKQHRIADLIQKYIPYPILLCIWHNNAFVLNTCDKKINQNDSSRRIVDKKYHTEIINRVAPTERCKAFLSSLAFAALDKTNLKAYYDAYSQRIIALQAAELTGGFTPRTWIRTQSDLDKLDKIAYIQKEIELLQSRASKESQLNQRISLNIEIQEKRQYIEQLKALITAS